MVCLEIAQELLVTRITDRHHIAIFKQRRSHRLMGYKIDLGSFLQHEKTSLTREPFLVRITMQWKQHTPADSNSTLWLCAVKHAIYRDTELFLPWEISKEI